MIADSVPAADKSVEAERDDDDDAAAITPETSKSDADLGEPGPPLKKLSPFRIGFFGGLGLFVAWWLGEQVVSISSVLIQIAVALFLAAGLNPVVAFFERRGLRRGLAVLTVIVGVLVALTLFVVAIVPVITEQVASISAKAPEWFESAQRNRQVERLDEQFQLMDKIKDYVAKGDFAGSVFGGVLGFGLAVLGVLANTFVVTVLTLYFLSSLDKTKRALYKLAPQSRRERVAKLGDRVIEGVGGYVSGAFVVAACAGITSLIFLFVVGLGQYAVALAFVVALLDVIPMIGATIGAVIVTAIGFAEDPKIGLACLVFYLVYQQVENYLIYPRVMSKSVDVPGSVTVIAALIGAALLGVIGALLAIPTAAALLMLTREVFIRKQDEH